MVTTAFSNVVSITVPGTRDGYTPDEALGQQWTGQVLASLSVWFGGATATAALGGYMGEKGMVTETVNVVASFCTKELLDQHRDDVMGLALEMGRAMGQEAVAVVVNGTMHSIDVRASLLAMAA